MKKLFFISLFILTSLQAASDLWQGVPTSLQNGTSDKKVVEATQHVKSALGILAITYAQSVSRELSAEQRKQCAGVLKQIKVIVLKSAQLSSKGGEDVKLENEITELSQKLFVDCLPLIMMFEQDQSNNGITREGLTQNAYHAVADAIDMMIKQLV